MTLSVNQKQARLVWTNCILLPVPPAIRGQRSTDLSIRPEESQSTFPFALRPKRFKTNYYLNHVVVNLWLAGGAIVRFRFLVQKFFFRKR